ncbi:hypothetical protein GCM10010497_56410 [Streptomyces cinereoruber]|uniref:Uncharacterized protein n=1 Tax=Streptomyces cinereoruber TaxID=67260 RepID=A0AAV4KQU6_9ACTN|nr:hypothetical protein GCM10010497_56410 [Streptomyces cinereoruber]
MQERQFLEAGGGLGLRTGYSARAEGLRVQLLAHGAQFPATVVMCGIVTFKPHLHPPRVMHYRNMMPGLGGEKELV